MKPHAKLSRKDRWSSSDSRLLSTVVAPLVAFILVAISMRTDFFGGIFYSLICLALSAATVGLVSGIWIVFGRSSVILRSFGAFFTVINLLAINGIVGMLQR